MERHIAQLTKKAQEYVKEIAKVEEQLRSVIVGQEQVIGKTLIALIAQGHVLIEGVPGLAKTLLVKTLAECLDVRFVRLQFTPDLLPADIIGTKIYNHRESSFSTVKGPIFTNFILADEINRAPPKVQSALLEAMQERQVSIQGDTFKLSSPFLVLATQNPIESEGTYRLPEAQVDRFMLKLLMGYPSKGEEKLIIERFTKGHDPQVKKVLTAQQVLQIQEFSQQIYADELIEQYVTGLVDATRHPADYGIDAASHIEFGASPRASLWLILGAKANALRMGRGYVTPEDVRTIAADVLRHRIIVTYEAEAENSTSDHIIRKILDHVRVP